MVKKKVKKNKSNFPFFYVSLFAMFILMGSFIYFFGSEVTMPVSDINHGLDIPNTILKVIPGLGTDNGGALFDIVVNVPEASSELDPEEDLMLIVELTNLGPESTEVDMTYIITQQETGKIVYIEHETKIVETQLEFLKNLPLQKLPFGKYMIYAHMEYTNATATASDEFKINLYKTK